MGDRITIGFTNNYGETTPELYSQDLGREMINCVEKFAREHSELLDHTPGEVMVFFIKWMMEDVGYDEDPDLVLGNTGEADYSDNGLWIYNLDERGWE